MALSVVGHQLDRLLQRTDRLGIILQTSLRDSILHIRNRKLRLLGQRLLEQGDRFFVTRVLHIKHGIVKEVGNFDFCLGIGAAKFLAVLCLR